MTLAERIKAGRLERQMSQEELAHRAGLSIRAFRGLERGEILDPHYSTLSRLARALDTTVAELIGEPERAPLAQAPPSQPEVSAEERREWQDNLENVISRTANFLRGIFDQADQTWDYENTIRLRMVFVIAYDLATYITKERLRDEEFAADALAQLDELLVNAEVAIQQAEKPGEADRVTFMDEFRRLRAS